ncbi:hypothetical protein HYFRA_00011135 [Hymenoscyphus fraxineus]|uniref:Uncharacterized protein n=1 Tax=Hymenoscyphus fraxineus TaxID=746836 RepID=A0A9N9L5E1_9HELO|nr:hypothetical protein HYFRA_00011135 [Hymenoscyphus fraxineus]
MVEISTADSQSQPYRFTMEPIHPSTLKSEEESSKALDTFVIPHEQDTPYHDGKDSEDSDIESDVKAGDRDKKGGNEGVDVDGIHFASEKSTDDKGDGDDGDDVDDGDDGISIHTDSSPESVAAEGDSAKREDTPNAITITQSEARSAVLETTSTETKNEEKQLKLRAKEPALHYNTTNNSSNEESQAKGNNDNQSRMEIPKDLRTVQEIQPGWSTSPGDGALVFTFILLACGPFCALGFTFTDTFLALHHFFSKQFTPLTPS